MTVFYTFHLIYRIMVGLTFAYIANTMQVSCPGSCTILTIRLKLQNPMLKGLHQRGFVRHDLFLDNEVKGIHALCKENPDTRNGSLMENITLYNLCKTRTTVVHKSIVFTFCGHVMNKGP